MAFSISLVVHCSSYIGLLQQVARWESILLSRPVSVSVMLSYTFQINITPSLYESKSTVPESFMSQEPAPARRRVIIQGVSCVSIQAKSVTPSFLFRVQHDLIGEWIRVAGGDGWYVILVSVDDGDNLDCRLLQHILHRPAHLCSIWEMSAPYSWL